MRSSTASAAPARCSRTSITACRPTSSPIAKGISSAYMPIAATVVKNSVFDSFYGDPAENRQVGQVNTYGGHPVAAAVALRNIEIMQAEQLADRVGGRWAPICSTGLRSLMRHQIVGDVRGKGLLLGVELVKDRATKEPVGSGADHRHRRFLPR